MISTTSFGFKGLPHVSDNYKGDRYSATRYKIKKNLSKLGKVKKLYIDLNTGSGMFTLENDKNPEIMNIVTAICNSPSRMIKFSWEMPILKMKSEQDWLLPYKSWLFLNVEGSYTDIINTCKDSLEQEQQKCTEEYLQYLDDNELEGLWNEWELQCQMDEILTTCHLDFQEDEYMESNKRSFETMILEFDSEDEDSDDEEYDLVETFVPVSGKTEFTIQEICEHIRVLGACRGKDALTIKELTEYFGQKREYKKVPKTDLDVVFPKLSLN